MASVWIISRAFFKIRDGLSNYLIDYRLNVCSYLCVLLVLLKVKHGNSYIRIQKYQMLSPTELSSEMLCMIHGILNSNKITHPIHKI